MNKLEIWNDGVLKGTIVADSEFEVGSEISVEFRNYDLNRAHVVIEKVTARVVSAGFYQYGKLYTGIVISSETQLDPYTTMEEFLGV